MISLSITIFFCAMAILSLEIIWMRLFAIENYSSFGYMILSIALLGFGLGGIVVAKLAGKLERLRDPLLFWLTALFPVVVMVALFITKAIPFVPQNIIQDSRQWVFIALFYATLSMPFFVGSMILGVILTDAGQNVGKLYFADLVGSGLGGLVTLWAFYAIHPSLLPVLVLVIFLPAMFASAWRGGASRRLFRMGLATVGALVGLLVGIQVGEIEYGEFKGISYALDTSAVTDAKVVHEAHGPLGFIQVIESSSERTAAGLAMNSPMSAMPPVQAGIFVDGNKISSLARVLDEDETEFIDWQLSSLPFKLRQSPKVLLIGLGGGEGVRQAFHMGAAHVTVAEIDPVLVDMVRNWGGEQTGGLLSRPDVTVEVADGRDVARRHKGQFDMVILNFFDASGLSLAGSKSHSENYLYTVEAFRDFLGALAPDGLLVSMTPVEEPPRSSLRTLPALVEAAMERYDREPLSHSMMFIRGAFHGMALLKDTPFTEEQVGEMVMEADMRQFNASFFPGKTRAAMEEEAAEEAAHWEALEREQGIDLSDFDSEEQAQDPFFDLLVAIFQDDDRGASYIDAYPYDISPTYDDRPYFSAMIKDGTFDYIRESAYNPEQWVNEITPDLWSQPLALITLAQAAMFSLLVVLLAYFLTRRSLPARGKIPTMLYFACLGVGYMFVEMVLIQKLTHYVAAPAYAAAVVLTGMLVFSGLGSFFSERFQGNLKRGIAVAILSTCGLLVLYRFGLAPILMATISYPETVKIALAILLVGPVAFFMGMPFPLGMMAANHAGQGSAAGFGWAINGAVSVVGVVAAQVISMHWGFGTVFFTVMGIYLIAFAAFPGRWLR